MSKPYVFEPVIPVEEAVDLGSRLLKGRVGLVELKDANGICGCVIEKYDGEELPEAAFPASVSLQTLGAELKSLGEGAQAASADPAFDIAVWLPLILQIITTILDHLGNRRNDGGTVPGPV